MKVIFKKLSLQNFYSYGDIQHVNFDQFNSTVVLIDGIDKDTEGSKIGSGKSSIFAGLTFALFGETVSNVKVDGVVNYIRNKDCLVELEFIVDSILYKIQRGRKPVILNVYKFNSIDNSWENISKADSRDNDRLIETIIKINFETFLQTALFSVADAKPFLELRSAEQQQIFQYIFNFDEFNNFINEVKNTIRDKQTLLTDIEASNREIDISNSQIQSQIDRLIESSEGFEKKREKNIKNIEEKLHFYKNIDIDDEKERYSVYDEVREHIASIKGEISSLNSEIKDYDGKIISQTREKEILTEKFEKFDNDLEAMRQNMCPTCHQSWIDYDRITQLEQKSVEIGNSILSIEREIKQLDTIKQKLKNTIKEHREVLEELNEAIETIECSVDRKELDNLDIIITNLTKEYNQLKEQDNHFNAEIESLSPLIREQNITELDELSQFITVLNDFVKLSGDKKMQGKFLRKFIKQLNEILRTFKTMIPDYNIHLQFNPDFTIRIMKLGTQVSQGSLSNGEKRIGNIMIMLALMKVFRLKNNVEFNAMFLDEVLDSGINGTLLESVYAFIKNVAKNDNIRLFLISHRDEIKEKSREQILVTKSKGISTIEIMKNV